MQQRNGEAPGWRIWLMSALVPLLLAWMQAAVQVPAVLGGGLINPDSYMRLVRLRDSLDAGRMLDVVARDGSGTGTVLHWSHLLDGILLLLAAPLRLLLPPEAALHSAAVLCGPLELAALGVAIAWAAAPFAERGWLWSSGLLAAMSPAIGFYGLPGVVHHHVAVVLIGVLAGGWAARLILRLAAPRAGWALGAWVGVGLWLTPETLPLGVLAFGAVWLAWGLSAERNDLAQAMRAAGLAFLLVAGGAFLIDPPPGGYGATAIDRLSAPLVGLAAAIAVTGWATIAISRQASTPCGRLGWSLMSGLIACVCWLLAFPSMLHGADTMMNARDWDSFFSIITEMRPVTAIGDAVSLLLTGALAAIGLSWCAVRQRSVLLGYMALTAVGFVAVGQAHQRFAAYPEALAAAVLPIALTFAGTLRFGRLVVMSLVLLLPFGARLAEPARAATGGHACRPEEATGLLAPYAGQVVLGDVNATPELLYRTGVLTVGSLYHRNPAGYLRLRAAWRSQPSDTVPEEVRATQAALLLFCDRGGRSLLVADLPAQTLLDRLARGDVPRWLRLEREDARSGYVLYRVAD